MVQDPTHVGIHALGTFKLSNGDSRTVDPGLFILSSVISKLVENSKDFEVDVDPDIDLHEIELMNAFSKLLRENFMEKLKSEGAKKDFWFDFMPQNVDALEKLVHTVDKDLLIGGSNAADILDVPSFMAFCTYFLVKRSAGMNLEELRDFLNEENDFTEAQRRIIAECDELNNL